MDMKEHQQAIAQLIEQIKAAPEHDGIDYHFLALAGLEVAELAFAAMRNDIWIVDDAAAILGGAMAEAAHTGPERWIGRIEALARELTLLPTGGTVFHGRPHDVVDLGDMGLTDTQFARLKTGWQQLRGGRADFKV